MRKILLTLIAAVALVSSTTGFSADSEVNCLAQNIYHEARGASALDQRAVGHVTLNRKESGRFPNTICAVVRQPSQFSWVRRNPGITDTISYNRSIRTAEAVLSGNSSDPTHGATYFWNRSVNPPWSHRMTVTLRTQGHTYARH